MGLRTDEVIMIGDTMETDIRGATDLGFRSILVLTGSTTRAGLKEHPFAPTRTVNSIAELLPEFTEPQLQPDFSFLADGLFSGCPTPGV
jgi:NagD protein